MTVGDSLLVAAVGFGVVFLVLMLLSFLIKVQSVVLGYFMSRHKTNPALISKTDIRVVSPEADAIGEEDITWTAGELKLLGVDEKTAAMIMAIVSHESQIPLSDLQFKMIKAID